MPLETMLTSIKKTVKQKSTSKRARYKDAVNGERKESAEILFTLKLTESL